MSEFADLGEWECRRGDFFSLPIADTQVDGSETDLTGYGDTWAAYVRSSPDAEPHIAFDVDDSGAATGQLVLSLAGAATGAMIADGYVFDVQVTGGSESPLTLYGGTLKMITKVTRV